MLKKHLNPRYRAALFRRLEVADNDQPQLDRMFQLLDDGRRAARRAHLDELADRFASGQTALIDALRGTGHFLDWELAFIRVGLTAGDTRTSYHYLAAHYGRLADFLRQLRSNCWLPLAVLVMTALGLPALGYAEKSLSLGAMLALMGGSLLGVAGLVLLGGWLAVLGCQQRLHRRSIDSLYRLPGVGLLFAQQQSLHYFAALELTLGAGLPLAQSLQLATEVLPYSPRKSIFGQVHRMVAEGGRLSEALRQSGALNGVQIRGVAANSGLQGAALAQHVLTESTRQAVVEGLAHCARWLPQVALMGVVFILMANLLVM
jgi:type II secretory pathway component PulF